MFIKRASKFLELMTASPFRKAHEGRDTSTLQKIEDGKLYCW